jgi:hypothetical protein
MFELLSLFAAILGGLVGIVLMIMLALAVVVKGFQILEGWING